MHISYHKKYHFATKKLKKLVDILILEIYNYHIATKKGGDSMNEKEKKDIRETVKMLMQLDKESLLLAKQSINTIWAMERLHDKKAG